jgi:hypothetical protein
MILVRGPIDSGQLRARLPSTPDANDSPFDYFGTGKP